jgi:hypothetical protein
MDGLFTLTVGYIQVIFFNAFDSQVNSQKLNGYKSHRDSSSVLFHNCSVLS